MFEDKISCKYVATSQSKKALKNDTYREIFSAFSCENMAKSTFFTIRPPSRIETGYKFIIPRDKLHTIKNCRISVFFIKIMVKIANRKLNITPPKHTIASFLYDRSAQS